MEVQNEARSSQVGFEQLMCNNSYSHIQGSIDKSTEQLCLATCSTGGVGLSTMEGM